MPRSGTPRKSLLPCAGMVVMLEPQCVNCVSFKSAYSLCLRRFKAVVGVVPQLAGALAIAVEFCM